MRYILCVSLKHKPYKKTCSIQIFSNNCMLDDFELQSKKVHLRYIELDESAIGNELIFKIFEILTNFVSFPVMKVLPFFCMYFTPG